MHNFLANLAILLFPIANTVPAQIPHPLHSISLDYPLSATREKPSCPNTNIYYHLFTPHSLPLPACLLTVEGWERLATIFPDQAVTATISGICRFGARIGYEGVGQSPTIYPNLSTAEADTNLLTSDIPTQLGKNHLMVYDNNDQLPKFFTASLLGLIDKADGSKRRIHYLSYLTSNSSSINEGIQENYGTITYNGICDTIQAIQAMGRDCLPVKRDIKSVFGHISVSPVDSPLLEFHWEDTYYAESFLPFGLHTTPNLFNLFAEVFHWILEEELKKQGLRGSVIQYLDDFLMILSPHSIFTKYTTIFATLWRMVGLCFKESKNEEGRVASFAGIEFDMHQLVIRLPAK